MQSLKGHRYRVKVEHIEAARSEYRSILCRSI